MAESTIPDERTEWVLDYGEETEIGVDGVLTGVGDRTKGDTYTYTLVFRDANRWPGEPRAVECFNDLLDRSKYAGEYELHEMVDGPPEYTPTWPTGETTLLVSLEPENRRTVPVPGLWGLIDSIEVSSAPITGEDTVPQNAALDLSLTYLADIREYETRDAITQDLENPGLF